MNIEELKFDSTGHFSRIILDYLGEEDGLRNFVSNFPSKEALLQQIELRKNKPVNRSLLTEVLIRQYDGITLCDTVRKSIDLLSNSDTFSICTAHQPCIFGGPLYFMYKIAHSISLALECKMLFPEYHFVPIFYIGSEDHDLNEIGAVNFGMQKFQWDTSQTGACGRMSTADLTPVTRELLALLDENIPDQLFLKNLIHQAFSHQHSLAFATRILVNGLFEKYGLLIVDGDDARLKETFIPVFENELQNQTSFQKVNETVTQLSKQYKIQTKGREINLFYLKDSIRERIEKRNDFWYVLNTDIHFTREALQTEIENYPEHFSPNVVLRPLYQETILPNIAYVGGGGEVAYWLELKSAFQFYQQPFPLLFVRNSFLFIGKEEQEIMKEIQLMSSDLFLSASSVLKSRALDDERIKLLEEKARAIISLINEVGNLGEKVDVNLYKSVVAHKVKMQRILDRIEQKFISHLKKRDEITHKKFLKIQRSLFPRNSLQERHDHFIFLYKKFGKNWFDLLISAQAGLGTRFLIIKE